MNTRTRPARRGLVLPLLALLGLVACNDDEGSKISNGWSGILSANVDGVTVDFTDRVRIEEVDGNDLWVIGDAGDTQLQFYISSVMPGVYSTDGPAMGRYVPDTSIPDYDYAAPVGELRSLPGVIGGTITVEIATSTRFAGHFSFQVATPALDDSMTISDGVFDLQYGPIGGAESPVGIWQRTVTGIEQESIEFLSGGTLNWISASYSDELCHTESGSWDEDGDSLRLVLGGETFAVAWRQLGTGLALWDAEDSTPSIFAPVNALPTCEDYGFGGNSTGWTGTLTANIDGALVDFSEELWLEQIGTGDAWVIANAGDHQIQFYVTSNAPGVYLANPTSSAGMGRFVPDTSVPDYDYSNPVGEYNTNFPGGNGSITVTQGSADALVGSFSFVVFNAASHSITITAGVVDIQRVIEATPAGRWQSGEDGLFEDTIELADDGSYARVQADWLEGECTADTDVWTHTADRIFIGTGLNTTLLADWSLDGSVLTLDFGGGLVRDYLPAGALPSCDDYTFDPLQLLYGAWQHGSANFDDNIEFREDGGCPITVALFADDYCFELDASWVLDGDSLRITYHDGFGPPAYGWVRSGSDLLLSAPGQGTMVYTPLDALPACADYDFDIGIPVGIWQQTAPDWFEYSLEFAADGDFARTYANFEEAWCFEEYGTWTASTDSLFIQFTESTEVLAYERYGVSLRITFPDGFRSTLYLDSTMPVCADYDLEAGPRVPDGTRQPLLATDPAHRPRSTSAFREH